MVFASSCQPGRRSTARQRQRRVSVIIHDDRPPHRAVIARGQAELLDLNDQNNSLTQAMAIRYLGRVFGHQYMESMQNSFLQTGITLVHVRPEVIRAFGNTRQVSKTRLSLLRARHFARIPTRWL